MLHPNSTTWRMPRETLYAVFFSSCICRDHRHCDAWMRSSQKKNAEKGCDVGTVQPCARYSGIRLGESVWISPDASDGEEMLLRFESGRTGMSVRQNSCPCTCRTKALLIAGKCVFCRHAADPPATEGRRHAVAGPMSINAITTDTGPTTRCVGGMI